MDIIAKHSVKQLTNGGFVLVLNTEAKIDGQAEAMLQALHSRSTGGIKNHLKVLEEKGAEIYFNKWPRHLRVGLACSVDRATGDGELENILRGVLFLAREWCWVTLWIFGDVTENGARVDKTSKKFGMPSHQNIKFNYMPGNFSGITVLFKLIERSFGTKKRKKYDIVMVDNEKTAALLEVFRFIHNTEIMIFRTGADILDSKPALDRIKKR